MLVLKNNQLVVVNNRSTLQQKASGWYFSYDTVDKNCFVNI